MAFMFKELRKKKGLTQNELAEAIGEKVATYRTWEQGKRMCAFDQAALVADVLDCTLDELAGRTPPAQAYADPRQGRLNDVYAQLDDDGRAVVCEIAEFQVCKDEAGVSEEAAGDKRRKTG